MRSEPFDHAPIVKAWLDEPVWLPESDLGRLAAIVHQTPQQRGWLPTLDRRSFRTMPSASYVITGVSVALLGGVLLNGAMSPQPDQPLPGANATVAASPAVESAAPSVAPTAEGSAGSVSADRVVMGAPSGASVGGWTEIGRTPVVNSDSLSLSELRDLTPIGDALIGLGTLEETAEGPSHPVVLHSIDGLTWLPITVPGTESVVTDLAAYSNGVLAGGSETRDGERAGALWTSTDGLMWIPIEEIPFSEVDRIVSAESPMVITDTSRRPSVWVSANGSDWRTSRRVNDFSIGKGPGGFLMWRGGGQDKVRPIRLLYSADATDFQEVEPSFIAMGDDEQADVSVFALADRWILRVLFPSRNTVRAETWQSTDGVSWDEALATRATEDVRWVANVGDEFQAFGHATPEEADPTDLVPTPSALWTWQLGEASSDPIVLDPEGDDYIDTPVAFGDGYLAVGRDGGEDAHVTVWRYEPAAS